MKKILSTLILLLFTFITGFSQNKEDLNQTNKLSIEQQTILRLKKLKLKLNLTDQQTEQIKPLLANQITEDRKQHEKQKTLRKEKKKLSSNEKFEIKNKQLDRDIEFKDEIRKILNEEQYEKFQKNFKKQNRRRKKFLNGKKRKKRKKNNKKEKQ